MLLVNPGSIMTIAHCPVTDSGASMASFQMMLAMNPVSSLIVGWALMLVAMMSPTLIAPIRHVIERSFKRRRVRSVTLFRGWLCRDLDGGGRRTDISGTYVEPAFAAIISAGGRGGHHCLVVAMFADKTALYQSRP